MRDRYRDRSDRSLGPSRLGRCRVSRCPADPSRADRCPADPSRVSRRLADLRRARRCHPRREGHTAGMLGSRTRLRRGGCSPASRTRTATRIGRRRSQRPRAGSPRPGIPRPDRRATDPSEPPCMRRSRRSSRDPRTTRRCTRPGEAGRGAEPAPPCSRRPDRPWRPSPARSAIHRGLSLRCGRIGRDLHPAVRARRSTDTRHRSASFPSPTACSRASRHRGCPRARSGPGSSCSSPHLGRRWSPAPPVEWPCIPASPSRIRARDSRFSSGFQQERVNGAVVARLQGGGLQQHGGDDRDDDRRGAGSDQRPEPPLLLDAGGRGAAGAQW